MQAIVPLAGMGTRLRPLTHSRPKPLVRVANRPVLAHVIEMLREEGVDEIIGITGYRKEQIEEFFEDEYPDLETHFVEQERQIGTADAIGLARPHVEGPVLIVFVDTLFSADFDVIRERPDADGIVWAYRVDNPEEFGVVVTDDRGYMKRIDEKPEEPVSDLANIGVYYIRDPELMFEGIDEVMAGDPHLGEYFLTDAFQYMIDHGAELYTAPVDGWWDCGKPETILETNRVLLEGGEARDPDGRGLTVNRPVRVAPDATVAGSEIGPNVSIASGAEVRDCRLRDCIVGEDSRLVGCELAESLIGDQVDAEGLSGQAHLGDHCRVRRR